MVYQRLERWLAAGQGLGNRIASCEGAAEAAVTEGSMSNVGLALRDKQL